jgi:hypothetical protein
MAIEQDGVSSSTDVGDFIPLLLRWATVLAFAQTPAVDGFDVEAYVGTDAKCW